MYTKKKNRSGTTSVVVVEKSAGKIRYLTTIGVSSDDSIISELYIQGKKWIIIPHRYARYVYSNRTATGRKAGNRFFVGYY